MVGLLHQSPSPLMQLCAHAAYQNVGRHLSEEDSWTILDDSVGLRDGSEDYVTLVHIQDLIL